MKSAFVTSLKKSQRLKSNICNMTNLECFVELWLKMDGKERMGVLKFLTEAYGENLLQHCNKLLRRLEKQRDKR